MKPACYLRVSSLDQVTGFSLETQERLVRDYCARQGWETPTLYVEAGRSAFKERAEYRPAFTRMLQDGQAGAFRVLVVYQFDRFARWASVALGSYQVLKSARVRVVSVTEPVDPDTAFGKLQFTQMAASAEYYSAALSERLLRVFEVKREKGHKMGPTAYGAMRDPATRRQVLDPAWERHLRRFLEVAAEHSYVETCAILNAEGVPARWGGPWHPATVGSVVRHGAWLVEQPEPWPTLWRATAQRRPAPPLKREAKPRLLTGLARCACGGSIVWRAAKDGPTYCVCVNWRERAAGAGCPRGQRRRVEWYEDRVTEWFLSLPDLSSWTPASTDEVGLARRASLVERRRKAGIRWDLDEMEEPEYRALVGQINAEIATIDRAAEGERVGVIQGVTGHQGNWSRMSIPERNEALRFYLQRVIIDGQGVRVEPYDDILAALASLGFTHPLH